MDAQDTNDLKKNGDSLNSFVVGGGVREEVHGKVM